jgi:hypothetical protein
MVKVEGTLTRMFCLESVVQLNVDRHRPQFQILVILNHRPDEGRAAVQAARAAPGPHAAIDDQDAIGGAPPVAAEKGNEGDEEKGDDSGE